MDQQTIQGFSSTGRHQECLQACQQLLQSESEAPFLWKYAGKSLLALGQFEKAQQCLVKAHQLDTTDQEILKDIGNTYLKLGSPGDAEGWYKKSLEIDNNYTPAINNLAELTRRSGREQEAVDLFKRAIQAVPQLIQAYLGAAQSLLTLKDLGQAELFVKKAIEINADFPGINELIGIINQNKGNTEQAIKHYQKELKINQKASNSLLNIGLLLLQKGQAHEAIDSLKAAASINPSTQSSLLLAQAYQCIGKLKEAIIEYNKIDLTKLQNKMIPFNLGLCLLNTGDNIDALKAFKLAIYLDDSFTAAWVNTGAALMNEGRYHEALQATRKAIEVDPNNPDVLLNLCGIYVNLGNLDQALISTLKFIELKPDDPIGHMNLGAIYKELGKLDQALASTLKFVELKPDDPNAHMFLGTIYRELGKPNNAHAFTVKSLKLKPDNPDALINLFLTYGEGELSTLESTARRAVRENQDILNNLTYIEVISSLGKKCAKDIISTTRSPK